MVDQAQQVRELEAACAKMRIALEALERAEARVRRLEAALRAIMWGSDRAVMVKVAMKALVGNGGCVT